MGWVGRGVDLSEGLPLEETNVHFVGFSFLLKTSTFRKGKISKSKRRETEPLPTLLAK